jgi:regulator of protease activity HflC (stomatin/prohibitin superfamily)
MEMKNPKHPPPQPLQVRPREELGWRQGRPVEDPNKTKKWGFVTAKPSEFLVHCRSGAVLPGSGQGATCFKWPWDSVSVVPTSFQRLRFVADQVTSEKVGVQVTGIAVYRIAQPQLAFRVLNFSYPERAQEKLERTMTEMLMGATRRLVANLTVEECLQKRKAALADELVAEIAPVVGGTGRPEDHTDQGWGVVLDTVEIQEVRVLSETVFAAMQEPFRASPIYTPNQLQELSWQPGFASKHQDRHRDRSPPAPTRFSS